MVRKIRNRTRGEVSEEDMCSYLRDNKQYRRVSEETTHPQYLVLISEYQVHGVHADGTIDSHVPAWLRKPHSWCQGVANNCIYNTRKEAYRYACEVLQQYLYPDGETFESRYPYMYPPSDLKLLLEKSKMQLESSDEVHLSVYSHATRVTLHFYLTIQEILV